MENNTHNNDLSGKLYHHTVSPSDAVWNRIQAQLDADMASFNTCNRQRLWWYAGSLAAVAAIVFFTWNHYDNLRMQAYDPVGSEAPSINKTTTYFTDNQLNNSIQLNDQFNEDGSQLTTDGLTPVALTASTSQSSDSRQDDASTDLLSDVTLSDDASLSTDPDQMITPDDLNEEMAAVSELPENADATLSENADAQEMAQVAEGGDIDLSETMEAEIEPVDQPKKPVHSPFEGFYAGVSGGWHASTMLTDKEVVINDNAIQTGVRFGPSKGLTLGYVFGPNLSLQAEYLYNVVEGQNYYMEVEGGVRSKTMSLYFDQIPVTVKLRTPRTIHAFKMPASLNIVAGTQLNILKDYQVPRENKLELEGDIYRKTSFSFLAGAEYEVLVTDHIMLSLGVGGSLSENVSTSNDPVGNFPKQSISGGAKGGIYYLFGH